MEAVTVYKAADGSTHATPEAATARDALVAAVADAMALLRTPSDAQQRAMSGGAHYLSHAPAAVVQVRARLLELAARQMPSYARTHPHLFRSEVPTLNNFIGRILDDVSGPLNDAWGRLMRIGEDGREWEQPYFVLHPPTNAKPGPTA
jgi:hypothetical protein